ncbi:Transferrin, partial [Eumeta japonica]
MAKGVTGLYLVSTKSTVQGQFAFETVAVVMTSHIGGLEGLRQGGYCHPGVDTMEEDRSPRVLKALEREVTRIDRCSKTDTRGKTLEELEVSALSNFFRAACRPGRWSLDYADDARLKREYPNLCTLCSGNATSDCLSQHRYGAEPDYKRSTHALALDCLTEHGGTVAYVEWRHASEYFLQQKPELISNYALLCLDNTLVPLTRDILNSKLAACAWVQQPWGAVVASTHQAVGLLAEMKTWWPSGDISIRAPVWEHMMFSYMFPGSDNILEYEDALPNVLKYVSS